MIYDLNFMLNEIYDKQQRALEMGYRIDDLYLCVDRGLFTHLYQLAQEGRIPELKIEDRSYLYMLGLKVRLIHTKIACFHLCIK